MKIIRITDQSDDHSRHIYGLVENLSAFTLQECRGREDICLNNINSVLILDHIDESSDAKNIIGKVSKASAAEILILVTRTNESTLQLPHNLNIEENYLFVESDDQRGQTWTLGVSENILSASEVIANILQNIKEKAA